MEVQKYIHYLHYNKVCRPKHCYRKYSVDFHVECVVLSNDQRKGISALFY
jgi:hypothetical protein